jgi:hypothetical protein
MELFMQWLVVVCPRGIAICIAEQRNEGIQKAAMSRGMVKYMITLVHR